MNSLNKINCGCKKQNSNCGSKARNFSDGCVRQPGQRHFPKEPCNLGRENPNPTVLSSVRQVQNEMFSPYCAEAVNCGNKEQVSMQGHPLYNKMYMKTSMCHKYPVHYLVPPVDINNNIISGKNIKGCGSCNNEVKRNCSDPSQCNDCGYMTTSDLTSMQKRMKREEHVYQFTAQYRDNRGGGKQNPGQKPVKKAFNKAAPHSKTAPIVRPQRIPRPHTTTPKIKPKKFPTSHNKNQFGRKPPPPKPEKGTPKGNPKKDGDNDMVETCGQYDGHGPHGCLCHCAVTTHGPLCSCNETYRELLEFQAYHHKNRIEHCMCQGCNSDCWDEHDHLYEFAAYDQACSDAGRKPKKIGNKKGQEPAWSKAHKVPFTRHRPSIDETESKLKHLDHVAAGVHPKKQHKNYLYDHRKTSEGEIRKRDNEKPYAKKNLNQLQKYDINVNKNKSNTKSKQYEDKLENPEGAKNKPRDERPANLLFGISSNISSSQNTAYQNKNVHSKLQNPPINQRPQLKNTGAPQGVTKPQTKSTSSKPKTDISAKPKSTDTSDQPKATDSKTVKSTNSKVASQQNTAVKNEKSKTGTTKSGGTIITMTQKVLVKVPVEEEYDDDDYEYVTDSDEDVVSTTVVENAVTKASKTVANTK